MSRKNPKKIVKETKNVNNLIVRSITGALFVIVLVGCIVYNAMTFSLLFALITALSVWEFSTLVNLREDVHVNRMICTVSGVYLFFAVMGFSIHALPSAVFIPYLLTVIYLLVSELYLQRPNPMNNWAYAFAGQVYVALPFALMHVLAFRTVLGTENITYSYIYPLSVFIFLWANDSGAYCFGSMLHKYIPYKLFPRISPNKSWIGSIGGGVLVVVAAIIIAHFYQEQTMLEWVGLGLVVSIFGTWGDLVESQIKRSLNIKDSGKFLPGHGGLLDRFDSSLLAFPAAVLYLYTITLF